MYTTIFAMRIKLKETRTEPKAKPRKRYNVDLHVYAPLRLYKASEINILSDAVYVQRKDKQ